MRRVFWLSLPLLHYGIPLCTVWLLYSQFGTLNDQIDLLLFGQGLFWASTGGYGWNWVRQPLGTLHLRRIVLSLAALAAAWAITQFLDVRWLAEFCAMAFVYKLVVTLFWPVRRYLELHMAAQGNDGIPEMLLEPSLT